MTGIQNGWEPEVGGIHVGLVNNMPDSALEATERQFRSLLFEAAGGMAVRLSFLALPEVPRSSDAKRHIDLSYASLSALWGNRLDGLIVTGAEPVAANLMDEPFWPSLTRLIDWAEHNTYSSIWSCLAAHAAVLHLDGVKRRPLGHKRCGVFACATLSDHVLTADVPDSFSMPHSRWNDLPGDALSSCGYRILSELKDGGVDLFVKEAKNQFVFFQGHPEYEAASLLLEYRRDIRRFLKGEREGYPLLPHGYFDEETRCALTVLQARAMADRNGMSFSEFPAAMRPASVKNTWRPHAVLLYRNWLRYLVEQKCPGSASKPRPMQYAFPNVLSAETSLAVPKVEAG